MKDSSIFKNTYVVAILSLFIGILITGLVNWFMIKHPEIPLMWIMFWTILVVAYVLYQLDLKKESENLKQDIKYIKEQVNYLVGMNKKGQYEKLVLFLVLVAIFLLVFWVISKII